MQESDLPEHPALTIQHLAEAFEDRAALFRQGLKDPTVDWHIHGVSADIVVDVCARFLFDVAEASGDTSLLPMANLALRAVADFQAEQSAIVAAQYQANDRYFSYSEKARKFCFECIKKSKSPRFDIDMTRYQLMVTNARAAGGESKILDGLDRYLSEKTVRHKIYRSVLNRVRHRGDEPDDQPLPTLIEVEAAFDAALADIYMLADAYVPYRIDLALQGIRSNPSASDITSTDRFESGEASHRS